MALRPPMDSPISTSSVVRPSSASTPLMSSRRRRGCRPRRDRSRRARADQAHRRGSAAAARCSACPRRARAPVKPCRSSSGGGPRRPSPGRCRRSPLTVRVRSMGCSRFIAPSGVGILADCRASDVDGVSLAPGAGPRQWRGHWAGLAGAGRTVNERRAASVTLGQEATHHRRSRTPGAHGGEHTLGRAGRRPGCPPLRRIR